MPMEAVVLDRDHRAAQRRRDLAQRHVVALLDKREPRPAVGPIEDRVSHPAGQAVDRKRVAARPEEDDEAQHGRGGDQQSRDHVRGRQASEDLAPARPLRSGRLRDGAHGRMTAFTTRSAAMSSSASPA